MTLDNFTDDHLRLGEYPQCIDIECPRYRNSDTRYHSNYGVIASFSPSNSDPFKCFTVMVRCLDTLIIRVLTCKWEEQIDSFINDERLFRKGCDIIYDSRNPQ